MGHVNSLPFDKLVTTRLTYIPKYVAGSEPSTFETPKSVSSLIQLNQNTAGVNLDCVHALDHNKSTAIVLLLPLQIPFAQRPRILYTSSLLAS